MSDVGMTPAELHAFHSALRSEANPSHLFGFASALAPDHCTSASMLHARGTLLEKRHIFGTQTVTGAMESLHRLAFRPPVPRTPSQLLRARQAVDALAATMNSPPALLHRKVRQTAGEMVVDDRATFADVPHVIVALARPLVLQIGPVRVLDPSAVRLALPPTMHLASSVEMDDRARWIRHYALQRSK